MLGRQKRAARPGVKQVREFIHGTAMRGGYKVPAEAFAFERRFLQRLVPFAADGMGRPKVARATRAAGNPSVRTFDVDVKQCPKCTGRVRVIAVIDDEATATAILREVGHPPAAPAPRARDPDELFGDPADSYDAC